MRLWPLREEILLNECLAAPPKTSLRDTSWPEFAWHSSSAFVVPHDRVNQERRGRFPVYLGDAAILDSRFLDVLPWGRLLFCWKISYLWLG